MPVARTAKDADRMTRSAAAQRLRDEHGISLTGRNLTSERLASAIMKIEPGLSGDPMCVVRAWLAIKPEGITPPRQIIRSTRSYSPAKDMAGVLGRLTDTPRPAAMVSKVPPTAMDWR